MVQIEPGWWMPDDLVLEEEKDLISLVAHSLNFDISKARAFVVAVLQEVDDLEAAVQINELLGTLE